MAAQIHSRGYALIEQGRIEEIIQAKPHELRTMVEEAAGLVAVQGAARNERAQARAGQGESRPGRRRAERDRASTEFRPAAGQEGRSLQADPRRAVGTGTAGGGPPAARTASETRARSRRASSNCARIPRRRAARSKPRRAEPRKRGAALAIARDELAAAGRELDNLRAAFEERARTRGFLERRLGAIARTGAGPGAASRRARSAGDRRTRRARRGRRAPGASEPTPTTAPAKRRSPRCAPNIRRPNRRCATDERLTESI